jgi:predicted nucleotidyltransferase
VVRVAAPPLLPLFRSRLQGELLALLLADGSQRWTIDELAHRTQHPYQTVATEVRRWQAAGMLDVTIVGRTKLFSAKSTNPYVRPLTELVLMAFGPPLVITEEFSQVTGVEQVFIYGSWAARFQGEPGPTPNDIDVLIVGTPARDDIYSAAARSQQRMRREVNVTQRTSRQWAAAEDGFTQHVRSSPLVELPYPQGRAEMEQGQ